ncbi:MAG: outer membrane beta-barrel protein [Coxiellaceae bacterium]|nr:outer membrane beta-barrel protein [Coxiellaceae bacterium]
MSNFLKAITVAGVSLAATSLFAGGIEPGPMMDDMSGVFVGVGAGYTSMNANNYNISRTAGGVTTSNGSFEASTDGLAPFGQLGYWGNFDQNWMWGVKGFYKYLNASANYVLDNNFSSNNFDTVVSQEAGALVMAGYHMNKSLAYIGVGPVWMPVQSKLRDRTGTGATQNFSSNVQTGSWGAVLGLGVRYDVTPSWFLDSEYSYAFTGQKTYTGTLNNVSWSRQLRVHVQQFDVSVNYRFAI